MELQSNQLVLGNVIILNINKSRDRMAVEDNVNFLELACLFKITQDTTLERFGGTINASVFDAANITGSLKQKGLIDFTAYYPGPNSITLTDTGKKLKTDAETRSTAAIDNLDEEILKQMSGGKRYPLELQNTLNIRSMDLAFRIYKLFKQNLLAYELKNGNVELMLTEQGFLRAKTPQAVQTPMAQPQQTATEQQAKAPAQQAAGKEGAAQANEQIKTPKKHMNRLVILLLVIILIILVLVVLVKLNKINLPFKLPF
jgi:hypothetical protein